MRLWHKDLIPILPREQLVAQWRECSAIAGNIKTKGTPNHILVNKIMDYSFDHFITYAATIRAEMTKRGYRTMDSVWQKIISIADGEYEIIPLEKVYPAWHNTRYLYQCYMNLAEKYDCGGIEEKDWKKITDFFDNKAEEAWLNLMNQANTIKEK